jgi:hypothetical protein
MSINLPNNHQICRRRDREILNALENYKVLNTPQLAMMFFPSLKMAQKRMNILAKNKKVRRGREYIDQPNYYFSGRRPNFDIEYWLNLNWVRLFMERRNNWGDKIAEWIYLDEFSAVARVFNTLNGNYRKVKIEVIMGHLNADKYEEENPTEYDVNFSGGKLLEECTGEDAYLFISDMPELIRREAKEIGLIAEVFSLDQVRGFLQCGKSALSL